MLSNIHKDSQDQQEDYHMIAHQLKSHTEFYKHFSFMLHQTLTERGIPDFHFTTADRKRITSIRRITKKANQNNLTRTTAYWNIFKRHPELHWAYLAHIISRNGGWNMTDLQGTEMQNLLDSKQRNDIFQMLESANRLIFQDAFPQLLIYLYSKKAGKPLFHLLPAFQVSRFMAPFWYHFWRHGYSEWLTTALIINEQNYIQSRVVKQPYFQKHVLRRWFSLCQGPLQLNQLVIPYGSNPSYRLTGLILETFPSLKERIEFGKAMYGLLFGDQEVLVGSIAFSRQTTHTASRFDYLTFGDQPTEHYRSLPLQDAWPEHWPTAKIPSFPLHEDWFRNLHPLRHLKQIPRPKAKDMNAPFQHGIKWIERAGYTWKWLTKT